MSAPAIVVEALPAGFGDCLLVTCDVGGRPWRLLVDTGPDETYPALRRRLQALPPGPDGRRHVDLFVVSHIDHDHIGGARLLLDDAALGLRFGDIWFNAPPAPARRVRGVAEGESLATLLGAAESALPWNAAWRGEPVATGEGEAGRGCTLPGGPTLTLLSPTPSRLDALYKVWAKELERLRRREHDAAAETEAAPVRRMRGGEAAPDLEVLAHRRTATDHAVPNGSSIALLLEHRGASALLAADAFADVLVPQLRALAGQRGQSRIEVDLLKLSHHGSRANVTRELLDAVHARHYVVSTDNAYFRHPDAEAIARVVTAGGRSSRPLIWFNHDTPRNRQWADPALIARWDYEVRYPDGEGRGAVVELPARDGDAMAGAAPAAPRTRTRLTR